MKYVLDTDNFCVSTRQEIEQIIRQISQSACLIDINIRNFTDSSDTRYNGDWLKHLRPSATTVYTSYTLEHQPILMFGKRNRNDRLYSKEIAEQIVKTINTKQILGTIGFNSSTPDVDLVNASHQVLSAEIYGDNVYATIALLSTPKGKILERLVTDPAVNEAKSVGLFGNHDSVLKFAVAGVGSTDDSGIVTEFTLKSVNATCDSVSHDMD